MINKFVKLTCGTASVDNSMGKGTKRFTLDPYPLYVKPDIILAMQQTMSERPVTLVTLTNSPDYPVWCLETPEQIMEQIEAIKCYAADKALTQLECEHVVLTDQNGNSYCPNCGKEWR